MATLRGMRRTTDEHGRGDRCVDETARPVPVDVTDKALPLILYSAFHSLPPDLGIWNALATHLMPPARTEDANGREDHQGSGRAGIG